MVVGGGAFWAPWVLLEALDGWNVGRIPMNLVTLVGLGVLWIATRARRSTISWAWVLAGIYVLGPAALLLGASFTSLPTQPMPGETLLTILFCLFPPMTLWLAGDIGVLPSVLVVTAALAVNGQPSQFACRGLTSARS
jgi:hypothetical protein